MSAAAQSEIARYTEAVRAALADMPAKARDELLEDLPEHLAEVAAEGEGPLEDRLGPPDRYAAELRASAGVAPRRKDSFADTARSAAVQVRGRLRRLDARIGPMIGYGTASEFLRLLRPAWWVLRGYLAAMIVTYATDSSGNGVLPRVEGNEFLGLLMLAVFVVASIWLGRRTGGLGRWPRQIVLAGSGLIVLIAFVWFLDVDRQARNAPWVDGGYVSGTPYDHISDVFVYDQDGNLVTGVYLYDQHGQPIVLGGGECVVVDGPVPRPLNGAYPRCVHNAPWGAPPSPSEPTEPATPEATPAETTPAETTPAEATPAAPTPAQPTPAAPPSPAPSRTSEPTPSPSP